MRITFQDAVGATGYLLAMAALVYLAAVTREPIVIGALVATSAAGAGFFLRAKVQAPNP